MIKDVSILDLRLLLVAHFFIPFMVEFSLQNQCLPMMTRTKFSFQIKIIDWEKL